MYHKIAFLFLFCLALQINSQLKPGISGYLPISPGYTNKATLTTNKDPTSLLNYIEGLISKTNSYGLTLSSLRIWTLQMTIPLCDTGFYNPCGGGILTVNSLDSWMAYLILGSQTNYDANVLAQYKSMFKSLSSKIQLGVVLGGAGDELNYQAEIDFLIGNSQKQQNFAQFMNEWGFSFIELDVEHIITPDAATVKTITDLGFSVIIGGDAPANLNFQNLDPANFSNRLYFTFYGETDATLSQIINTCNGASFSCNCMNKNALQALGVGLPFYSGFSWHQNYDCASTCCDYTAQSCISAQQYCTNDPIQLAQQCMDPASRVWLSGYQNVPNYAVIWALNQVSGFDYDRGFSALSQLAKLTNMGAACTAGKTLFQKPEFLQLQKI